MANVFMLSYKRRQPVDAWVYITAVAGRLGRSPQELWEEVKVTEEEMAAQVLA